MENLGGNTVTGKRGLTSTGSRGLAQSGEISSSGDRGLNAVFNSSTDAREV